MSELSSKEKVLKVNLDKAIYGTFAEIGAGQEVARNFFRAGAASRTIAKTMSAYDMKFSDAIYGPEKDSRYVCQSRLNKMLDHEFNLLVERLNQKENMEKCFFSFADTVTTRNNECGNSLGHGWLGVRFQHAPDVPPSNLIIHVRLHDKKVHDQQYALGVLGVNIMYAVFYLRAGGYESLVESLMDNLETDRIEIDFIEVNGPAFKNWDSRLLSFHLVKCQFTEIILFDNDGKVLLPSDSLYKKDILIMRGSFRPPTLLTVDMMNAGLKRYSQDQGIEIKNITPLCEMTMSNLATQGADQSAEDFLSRVDLLGTLGYKVLISNYEERFQLSTYFARFTPKPIGIIMGIYNLLRMMDPDFYGDLQGGIYQCFGVLHKKNTKLYVYPTREDDGKISTAKSITPPPGLEDFYKHLLHMNLIDEVNDYDPNVLHIYSRKAHNMIKNNEKGWEDLLPKQVVEKIKTNHLLGFN